MALFNPFSWGSKEKDERGGVMPEKHEGLPDSDRRAGLCPRCMKQSSFDVGATTPVTFNGHTIHHSDGHIEPASTDQASVLYCRHCHQGTVVVEEQYQERYQDSGEGGRIPTGGTRIRYRGVHWWPLPSFKASEVVPDQIADVYVEAQRAHAANCPRAAAVMGRRTLEAITTDLGETTGALFKRLENLKASGKLHPSLHEWATGIRLLGNAGAHFDPIQSVTEEESQQLVAFVGELIKYVYELPAELDRMRGSR